MPFMCNEAPIAGALKRISKHHVLLGLVALYWRGLVLDIFQFLGLFWLAHVTHELVRVEHVIWIFFFFEYDWDVAFWSGHLFGKQIFVGRRGGRFVQHVCILQVAVRVYIRQWDWGALLKLVKLFIYLKKNLIKTQKLIRTTKKEHSKKKSDPTNKPFSDLLCFDYWRDLRCLFHSVNIANRWELVWF